MPVDSETLKKFLKKISESSKGHDIYDLGGQLNLDTNQTDVLIKDLRDQGLVEDDSSKIMIQDSLPRLTIKLTEKGKKEVN